jgi:hypothetical protein
MRAGLPAKRTRLNRGPVLREIVRDRHLVIYAHPFVQAIAPRPVAVCTVIVATPPEPTMSITMPSMVTCEVVVAEMVMGEAVMPVVAAVMSTAMMAPATREYEVNGIRRSGKQAERAVCGLLRIGPGG